MPRKARVIVPNCPHHIVQRGHNRNVVFVGDEDYQYYLDNLIEAKIDLGIKVYAYCLMTNHVHLIVEPCDGVASVAGLMKRLAARQTRYVNKLERRTGSLWEGRYKISPIEKDSYLLACCRYVELNPVKAGMVEDPAEYAWSSYALRVRGDWRWLDQDSCYEGLATLPIDRARIYRQLMCADSSKNTDTVIQQSLQRNQLTGSARFIDEIEQRIGVRVERRAAGRPVKS